MSLARRPVPLRACLRGRPLSSSSSLRLPKEPDDAGARPAAPSSSAASTPSTPNATRPHMTASQIPSSSIGRIFHYGNLAASLAGGVAAEFVRRSGSQRPGEGANPASGLLLNEANVNRLVDKLSQMRGAALKLGQFLSIQDAHVLPPEVERVFRRVQDRAHYMPNWQLEQVMREDLGADWQSHFASFDRIPFASASIGQVHLAALSSPSARKVAVKVQFPNVAQSIGADLAAIGLLLPAARLLPRGLFLERTLRILSQELAEECDYTREADWTRRFRGWVDGAGRLGGTGTGAGVEVKAPWVWEGSTKRVLVMEFIEGVSVGGDDVQRLPQAEKDLIASAVMHLCLLELFTFRAMQTDPNWTNFLYSSRASGAPSLGLVDFGATREYSKSFIDNWLRLLQAAIAEDEDGCFEMSKRLGYLTGEENEAMRSAHIRSILLLGSPFRTREPFSFARDDGTWPAIAAEIRAQIPVMLQHRLVPPPRETLSLNRKLSGAFLLAARLDARVDCRTLWHKVTDGYIHGETSM